METRNCSMCKATKYEDDFNLLHGGRGGLRDECSECQEKVRTQNIKNNNKPSQRRSWADTTYERLNLNDNDY